MPFDGTDTTATVTEREREHTDNHFPIRGAYHYSVRAINDFGEGPWAYTTCNTLSGRCR